MEYIYIFRGREGRGKDIRNKTKFSKAETYQYIIPSCGGLDL